MPNDEINMRFRMILRDLVRDGDKTRAKLRMGGLINFIDRNNEREVRIYKSMVKTITLKNLRKRGTRVLMF